MAVKLNRYSDHSRFELNPWIVQAALDRFGNRRLKREEQQLVFDAVRKPEQVSWPAWRSVRPWMSD